MKKKIKFLSRDIYNLAPLCLPGIIYGSVPLLYPSSCLPAILNHLQFLGTVLLF